MITVTYSATLNLDDVLAPFDALWNMQPNEPRWYWDQRTNILHRLQEDMEDDLNKCDPCIDQVCLDHSSWISIDLPASIQDVKQKIQKIIDWAIAEYPRRLAQFHDDLLSDGEEIPLDVYRP